MLAMVASSPMRLRGRACFASLATCALVAVLALALTADLTADDNGNGSGFGVLRVAAAGPAKKLTEKQLNEIEDQWMEDEVEDEDDTPFKYQKTADGGRMPPAPGGPKTEMGFVTIKTSDKKKTDELAGRWSDQMMTGGIDVRGYTIEDNRILFVCDQRGYKDMNRVRSFVLHQAETVEFEWNNKKSVPGDVLADEEGGEAAFDPMAKFQAMQEEQAQERKRKMRLAKREAEKKAKAEKYAKLRKEREAQKRAEVMAKKAAAAAAAEKDL